MNSDTWRAADDWLTTALLPPDPLLDTCLDANLAEGLPPIDVSPLLGKFLHLLAQARGARRILEIGALGGYSSIWLARALPAGGQLITLELDPVHAAVARANIARAGLADSVDLIEGPALASLARLHQMRCGPFDLIFIDADKTGYPEYLDWSLKLSAPGTLIVADNVVRKGEVVDPQSGDDAVRGARTFIERVGAEPRLSATVLQTVGKKGYDGFLLARVLA